MSKTLVGLYGGETATRVAEDLLGMGCDRDDISYIMPAYGAGEAGQGHTDVHGVGRLRSEGALARMIGNDQNKLGGGLIDGLTGWGVPQDDAHVYAEGVRRGHGLVLLRAGDDKADRAADIMSRHNPIDIHGQASRWRQSGWQGLTSESRPYTDEERNRYAQEDSIPIVKEDVSIGKRQVEQGGVHLRSYTVEHPVEEHVSLRQESVEVERQPVDRPLKAGEDAFQDREITATETSEEAVVSKNARVVEEVNVRKDVKKDDRVIKEMVRETKVDVDPVKSGRTDEPKHPEPRR